ncbi:hypothetical protein QJS04_geneDACA022428 [Acorus gramineus]|uniref:Uncharacterized protein n=1 Tax=Acorus gramineus TaxID=55184 RepID=A0AAV9B940_ACOGR|nr:hypothetical protein QJS04_geneDACA022428 [Acorus gramineus]
MKVFATSHAELTHKKGVRCISYLLNGISRRIKISTKIKKKNEKKRKEKKNSNLVYV